MKYYKLPNGELVSTQADVKDAGFKLSQAPVEEVQQTDKEKLRLYINALVKRANNAEANASTLVRATNEAPASCGEAPSSGKRDMSAGAVLARTDAPGIDVDAIVETILTAKPHALARYATSVALAYSALSEKKHEETSRNHR